MLLFFDLPVVTKTDRKNYALFRKNLIKRGFFMIQFSVYTKIFANRDKADDERKALKKFIPEKGNVRIMIVTEKQYSRMECIVGGISNQEEKITEEHFIVI